MTTAAQKLASEGFLLRTTIPAGLAHWVWNVELAIEENRRIRVVDETILQLVGAGIDDPDQIASLMGLDDTAIVTSGIANLMRLGALEPTRRLTLSIGGQAVLTSQSMRETTQIEAQLRFDPYRNAVAFAKDNGAFLSQRECRELALHQLPSPREPSRADLHAHHLTIQARLEAARRVDNRSSGIDLHRVVPSGMPQMVFQEVQVQAWHRLRDNHWTWRVLVEEYEDAAVTPYLESLEAEGADMLPLVQTKGQHTDKSWDIVLAAAFSSGAAVVDDAREKATEGAMRIQMVVPPFPHGYSELGILKTLPEFGEDEQERKENANRSAVVILCVPEERSRAPYDPIRTIGQFVERHGIRVHRCENLLTRHGLLLCDDQVFVTRHHLSDLPGRGGRGIVWAESRTVTDTAKARQWFAKLAGGQLPNT